MPRRIPVKLALHRILIVRRNNRRCIRDAHDGHYMGWVDPHDLYFKFFDDRDSESQTYTIRFVEFEPFEDESKGGKCVRGWLQL